MKHTLYRHFDKDGNLLYVGISLSVMRRLSQHKKHAHWFNQISDIKIEFFETRQEAIKAEQSAISKENPKHNIYRPKIQEMASIRDASRELIAKRIVHFNPLYTMTSAAEILGVSQQRVKNWIEKKEIGYVSVGERRDPKTGDILSESKRITGWQLIDFIEYLEGKGGKHGKTTNS